MLFTNEEFLINHIHEAYDTVKQEIEAQYPNKKLTLLQASVSNKNGDDYYDTEIAYEIEGNSDKYLWVAFCHGENDLEGYIDEFYEEDKNKVLQYIIDHEKWSHK